jgi:hypothetical protein
MILIIAGDWQSNFLLATASLALVRTLDFNYFARQSSPGQTAYHQD